MALLNPKHYLNIRSLRKIAKDRSLTQDAFPPTENSVGRAKELAWLGWDLIMERICRRPPGAVAKGCCLVAYRKILRWKTVWNIWGNEEEQCS